MTTNPTPPPSTLPTLPTPDADRSRRARLSDLVRANILRVARARLAEWGDVPDTPPLRWPLLALTATAGLGATVVGATAASLLHTEPVAWLPPFAVTVIGLVATGAALMRHQAPFIQLARLLVGVGLGIGLLAALQADTWLGALTAGLGAGAVWWLTAAGGRAAAWAADLLDTHERDHRQRRAQVAGLTTILHDTDEVTR